LYRSELCRRTRRRHNQTSSPSPSSPSQPNQTKKKEKKRAPEIKPKEKINLPKTASAVSNEEQKRMRKTKAEKRSASDPRNRVLRETNARGASSPLTKLARRNSRGVHYQSVLSSWTDEIKNPSIWMKPCTFTAFVELFHHNTMTTTTSTIILISKTNNNTNTTNIKK
jgi:hypothetical protein